MYNNYLKLMLRTAFILIFTSVVLAFSANKTGDELMSKQISGPESFIPQAFDVLNYNVWLNLWEAPKPDAYGWCEITFLWTENPDSNKFYFHLH